MAFSNLTVKAIYSGDGVNDTFAIPHTVILDDSAETKVYIRDETTPTAITETLQTEGAMQDYTLTGAMTADDFHTDVVFNAGSIPSSDEKVIVVRELPLTQVLDLAISSSFNPEKVEEAFDRVVAMIQQVNEELSRAIKFPLTVNMAGFSAELPQNTQDDPQKVIVVNSAQDGFELGPSVGDISDASDSADAAAASAAAAATSETNAATSETNAAASATAAAASATSASDSVDDIDTLIADKIDGPASATDSNFISFDGTTGKLAKDSGYSPTDIEDNATDITTNATNLTNHIADTTTHGTTGDIVGTTDTQTLTNKTVGVGTASLDASSILDVVSTSLGSRPWPNMSTSQRDAISSPATGLVVFNTDTNQPDVFNSATWGALAGSGGSSGINYLDSASSQFEQQSVGDWLAYKNTTAGDEPTLNDLAGSVDGTFFFGFSATDAIRGGYSGVLNKDAANRQGHGARIPFTIDGQDLNKPLYVSFDFLASANYETDDVLPYIWDDTNNEVITLKRAGSSTRFTGRFFANSGSDYQLALHVATTNAAAYTLRVDNFVVGPSAILDMPVEKQETLGTSGDLTSGSLEAVRSGNIVVLTGSFGHSSSTSPSSAVGYLPDWATPDATQMNLYQHDSTAIRRLEVKSDGQISFVYRDFAGSGSASTGTSTFTISYNVPPLNPSALLTTTELLNQSGIVAQNILGSNQGSGGSLDSLDFSGLEVGQQYRVDIQMAVLKDATDAAAGILVYNSSTTSNLVGFLNCSQDSTDLYVETASYIFTAVDSNINFELSSVAGTTVIEGSGTKTRTFATLSKIPDFSVYGALNDGTWPTMLEVENGYTQRTVDYTNDNFVPIVASGSNSDGEWVRYADGTQIVHERENMTLTTSTAEGNVFRSNFGHTFTYPLPFTTTYGCTVTLNDGGGANAEVICAKTGASTGTDDVVVSIWSAANDTYTVTAAFTATGRWRA